MSIILESIVKSYNENVVLDSITTEISLGEMVSIVGKSGSGKSTLLNIIGLIDNPSSGQLFIQGHSAPHINSSKATKLRRNTIGYLFQNYALIENISVMQNLNYALAYSHIKNKQELIFQTLEDVSLSNKYKNKKVYELSGGEQQRVAIARLMLKPCDIILADEPTGSLDSVNRDAVIRLLEKLNKMGKTVIIVTHDNIVADACKRPMEIIRGVLTEK